MRGIVRWWVVVKCPPLDLSADHINDLVGQPSDALVAEVDGDARLLLLEVARGAGGVADAAMGDVLVGLGEGGLCKGHHLVVRDGRGRVVAHGQGTRGPRGLMVCSCAESRGR
jgi:hypothetical protein